MTIPPDPQKESVSFDNTEIAFSSKSNTDLKRAYWLFRIININFLVRVGPSLTNFAIKIGLPVIPVIKATIFKHFCGGVSIPDCDHTIQQLGKYKVGTILDYSVEGEERESAFESTANEIIATIHRAKSDVNIPFSVFKPTGIARFALLEKINTGVQLTVEEQAEFEKVHERFERICRTAYEEGVRIFIDAEESWIQQTIDDLTFEMMMNFNKKRAIVYNTFQMYRHDRLEYLKNFHQRLAAKGVYTGMKLVRGAYMEKERERALEMDYPSPIHPDKESTDMSYNEALRYCVLHIDRIAICAGTHNEESSRLLMDLMDQNNLDKSDERLFFSQLLGMSDNLSFNLSKAGYKVAKYVPYGPVKAVLPYLFRRAQENTAIAGQMGRELSLIVKEMRRRAE